MYPRHKPLFVGALARRGEALGGIAELRLVDQHANRNNSGFIRDAVHAGADGGGVVLGGGDDSGDGCSMPGVVFRHVRVFVPGGVVFKGDSPGEFGMVHINAMVGDGDGDSFSGETPRIGEMGVDAVQRIVIGSDIFEFAVGAALGGAGCAAVGGAVGVVGDDADAKADDGGRGDVAAASSASGVYAASAAAAGG